jgi:hypothetical protein
VFSLLSQARRRLGSLGIGQAGRERDRVVHTVQQCAHGSLVQCLPLSRPIQVGQSPLHYPKLRAHPIPWPARKERWNAFRGHTHAVCQVTRLARNDGSCAHYEAQQRDDKSCCETRPTCSGGQPAPPGSRLPLVTRDLGLQDLRSHALPARTADSKRPQRAYLDCSCKQGR